MKPFLVAGQRHNLRRQFQSARYGVAMEPNLHTDADKIRPEWEAGVKPLLLSSSNLWTVSKKEIGY